MKIIDESLNEEMAFRVESFNKKERGNGRASGRPIPTVMFNWWKLRRMEEEPDKGLTRRSIVQFIENDTRAFRRSSIERNGPH